MRFVLVFIAAQFLNLRTRTLIEPPPPAGAQSSAPTSESIELIDWGDAGPAIALVRPAPHAVRGWRAA